MFNGYKAYCMSCTVLGIDIATTLMKIDPSSAQND